MLFARWWDTRKQLFLLGWTQRGAPTSWMGSVRNRQEQKSRRLFPLQHLSANTVSKSCPRVWKPNQMYDQWKARFRWIYGGRNKSACVIISSWINILLSNSNITAPAPTSDYHANFAQLGAVPLWLITAKRAARPSIDHFLITSDPDKSHTLDDGLNHRQPH